MKLSLINVFVFIPARYMNHDIFIYTGKLTQTLTGMTSAQWMIDMCKDWQYNLKFALLNLTSAPHGVVIVVIVVIVSTHALYIFDLRKK